MTKVFLLFACLLVLPTTIEPAVGAAGEKVTLYGEYVWNNEPNNPGPLRAVFTNTGQNEWDVAFHFKFSGKNYTYRGSASGDLETGTLEGTAQNKGGRRTWTFNGSFQDGKFNGSHAEIKRSGPRRTGTMYLEPRN